MQDKVRHILYIHIAIYSFGKKCKRKSYNEVKLSFNEETHENRRNEK